MTATTKMHGAGAAGAALLVCLGLAGLAGPARAEAGGAAATPPVTSPAAPGAPPLSLQLSPGTREIRASYRCGSGAPFEVRYLNGGPEALALVPIGGMRRIMVSVIAADGARYVSGRYQWWTRGREATLTDRMSNRKGRTCTEVRP